MLNTNGELTLHQSILKTRGSYTFSHVSSSNQRQETNDVKEPCIKRRYIAALLGFVSYVLYNAFRMNIGVSLISMVNSPTNLSHSHSFNASNLTETFEESLLEKEENKFNWNSVVQSYILGSGFVGCFLTSGISGVTVERFGARVMIISSTLISSLCSTIIPFSADCHVHFFIAVLFVRGLAQGFLMSAVNVLMANWFPRLERGHLSTIVNSGMPAGIFVGGLLSGLLCECTSIGGWRSVFYSFGIAGILISAYFIFYLHEFPRDDPKISNSELKYILNNQENVLTSRRPHVPWKKVLSSLPVYALVYGAMGKNWAGYYFMSVHPKFLNNILHISILQNGVFSSVPFLLQAIVLYPASYLSFWLQKNNYLGVNKIRKMFNSIACTGYSSCLALIIISNYDRTVTLLCSVIMIPFYCLGHLGCGIVPVDMSPTFAGTLKAMAITMSSTNGFTIPLIAGALMKEEESTTQWTTFFLISITVVMSSGVVFAVFGSADVQEWNFSNTKPIAKDDEAKDEKTMDSNYEKRTDCVNHM